MRAEAVVGHDSNSSVVISQAGSCGMNHESNRRADLLRRIAQVLSQLPDAVIEQLIEGWLIELQEPKREQQPERQPHDDKQLSEDE